MLLQKLPIVVIQTFGYHLASPLYYSLQILMVDSSFFLKKNNKEMIVPWNFIKHMNIMSQSQGSKVGSENE